MTTHISLNGKVCYNLSILTLLPDQKVKLQINVNASLKTLQNHMFENGKSLNKSIC